MNTYLILTIWLVDKATKNIIHIEPGDWYLRDQKATGSKLLTNPFSSQSCFHVSINLSTGCNTSTYMSQ